MKQLKTTSRRGVRNFGNLESLEGRQMFAITVPIGPPVLPTQPPDSAGGTSTTALPVTLNNMTRTTRSDYLPGSGDTDMFKVRLNKGDFLSADIDPTSGNALSAQMTVWNATGDQQLAAQLISTEPENGAPSIDPARGFWAQDTGDYIVKVNTTGATNYNRSYDLNLQRIGMNHNQSNGTLSTTGAFRAWRSQDGMTLNVAGPSGYGFSLRSNWTPLTIGSNVTYTTSSRMYLSTPYLTSAIGGEIELQPEGTFKVMVNKAYSGWQQLGELTGTAGKFGFSLAPIADKVKQAIGLDVSTVGVLSDWSIKTGPQVKSSYAHMGIEQVLDGVPYLVYQSGETGKVAANFGDVTITKGATDTTVMIAEPADPYLYVRYSTFAGAGSVNGRIPFNNKVAPPSSILPTLAEKMTKSQKYFGHVFSDAEVEVAICGVPFHFRGDMTIDLDANNDGTLIGGVKAADLFKTGAAWGNLLSDMHIGHNGRVDVGQEIAGYYVRANLATGAVLYDGLQKGVWFHGEQHSPDIWAGTGLEDFKTDTQSTVTVKGYVKADGTFSISNRGDYTIWAVGNEVLNANATLTVSRESFRGGVTIKGNGNVSTPIGNAYVYGSIQQNGDFTWGGSINVDIGSSKNYIRGDVDVSFAKTGSTLAFSANGDFDARFTISQVAMVKVDLDGHLDLTYTSGGLDYDAGFSADCDFYGYNWFNGNWEYVGGYGGSFSINNDRVRLTVHGESFSMDLP